LVLFWGGPAKKEPRREGNSKLGGAIATAFCFSLAIAVYYKTKLQEELRPFGPTYFWTGAPKSKQKALFKSV
jgi:hypothetical protein